MILTYRDVIRKAASNSDIVGIYINTPINPLSPHLLMTRQNMEMIVQTGDDQISRFGSELKEALEKYPDDIYSDKKPAKEKDEKKLKAEKKDTGEGIKEPPKEKEPNKSGLDYAMERYYENPGRETFFQICEELVRAQYFNITAICPFESRETGMGYKLFQTPDYGYAYIVYSSIDKNPEMKDAESYAFVPWRTIFLQAAKDPDSTGIVINPYSGHQAYVWISPVYIRKIIQRAAMIMEEAQKAFEKQHEENEETGSLEEFTVEDLKDFDLDDDI